MPLKPLKMPFGHDYPPTLPNLLKDVVARHGDNEFLVMGDQRMTYRDAERESAEVAKGMLAMGLGKGSHVGILMPNCPEWVVAYFAAARVGALTVSLSTFFAAPEIAWGVRHNDIDTLIISAQYLRANFVERLETGLAGLAEQTSTELYLPQFPYLRRIIVVGDCDRPWAMNGLQSFKDAAAAKPPIDDEFLAGVEAQIVPSDMLITICTSGTTAEPKSVVHMHGTAIRAVSMFVHFTGLKPVDRIWAGFAFFWIGGQNSVILPAMFAGAGLYFSETPKPEDVVEVIRRERVTVLGAWPSQAAGIATYARQTGADVSSVRRGLGPQIDEHGVVIPPDRTHNSFGMTETFGMHSMEKWASWAPVGKGSNWGRHIPGVERRIFDPETGREMAPGEVGELFIRGSTLMAGYYKREREDVFTREGFFATGDLCSIDEDDYLFFHGRSTEMIKTGGANVSPKEVETVLHTYPGVREALVFGVPDEAKGEIVAAVVIAVDGHTLDADEIQNRLKGDVSNYKVPQEIVVMDYHDIPRTGSEKAIKRDLVHVIENRRK